MVRQEEHVWYNIGTNVRTNDYGIRFKTLRDLKMEEALDRHQHLSWSWIFPVSGQ